MELIATPYLFSLPRAVYIITYQARPYLLRMGADVDVTSSQHACSVTRCMAWLTMTYNVGLPALSFHLRHLPLMAYGVRARLGGARPYQHRADFYLLPLSFGIASHNSAPACCTLLATASCSRYLECSLLGRTLRVLLRG